MMINAITTKGTITGGKLFRIMQPAEGLTVSYLLKAEPEIDTAYRYDLTITINPDGGKSEQVKLKDISRCATEAQRIFLLFSENTVTPTTAYDVMDDYFAAS